MRVVFWSRTSYPPDEVQFFISIDEVVHSVGVGTDVSGNYYAYLPAELESLLPDDIYWMLTILVQYLADSVGQAQLNNRTTRSKMTLSWEVP